MGCGQRITAEDAIGYSLMDFAQIIVWIIITRSEL
jgi:hypothetical protein